MLSLRPSFIQFLHQQKLIRLPQEHLQDYLQ
uniref:Uncharacterized protein n=1 Tax=virus sp. ctBM815 TaxID=2825806 RepID=A0A8S5RK16_9VIRU|nr:MAG TPA: hypothetical protein [virus sp. ctBM815]